jgi:hypothetical protein
METISATSAIHSFFSAVLHCIRSPNSQSYFIEYAPKHPRIYTTCWNYSIFCGHILLSATWNDGIVEYWNTGSEQEQQCKIMRFEFRFLKPIIPQ